LGYVVSMVCHFPREVGNEQELQRTLVPSRGHVIEIYCMEEKTNKIVRVLALI